MGRAMRWLKKLLTDRKEERGGLKVKQKNPVANDGVEKKKRWSFAKQRKSGVDGGKRPSDGVAAEEPSQVRPCHCGAEEGMRTQKEMAAIVIQKSFRGYLARKALRALRSLVKLQALVRGYLVRKQAATTLRRLQALMRLQDDSNAVKRASHRRSMEQVRIVTRDPRMKPPAMPDHLWRLSDSTDSNYERSPRIVEMDTRHLRSRSTRIMSSRHTADDLSGCLSPAPAPSCSTLYSKQHSPRLSSVRRFLERDPRHVKTTQNTPRFLWTAPPHGLPAKSVDGSLTSRRDALVNPRYMSGTASSAARMRRQSATRHAGVPTANPSLTRASPRSSCTQVQGNLCFHCSKTTRTACSDVGDEASRDYYLDRMW